MSALSSPPLPRAGLIRQPARRARPELRRQSTALSRARRLALQLLVPATVLLLWQMSSARQWMPAQILPPPALVLESLVQLLSSGQLADNIAISFGRIALGFALGSGIGLLLGLALGNSAAARAWTEPTLKAVFSIPTIGWIPILILVFGIDETLKVLVIAKAVMVPVVLNTSRAIQGIPQRFLEVARVLGLGWRIRLVRLTIPAIIPGIFSGLRLGVSNAFIALIVVEMLAATEGIGYMMVWGRKLFQLDIVLAGIALVAMLGFALDTALRNLERHASRWEEHHG